MSNWRDIGSNTPWMVKHIGDLYFTVNGNLHGNEWWWYVEVSNDETKESNYKTMEEAMEAAEKFAVQLQAFLDTLTY